jgi:hypothetical protein
MSRRTALNLIIDLVAFIVLLGLAFTGIIMKYILPPGTGGLGRLSHGGYGRFSGLEREHIKYLWSMTRHEWGSIHFYLAAGFLILMAVHIILHWQWIKNRFKSLTGIKTQK